MFPSLNLSVREIAVCMDLTEANVRVIQFRALKRAAELDGLPPDVRRGAIEGSSILEAAQRLLKYI
jgi:hypothetical protein